MYLLNLVETVETAALVEDLHSTMYLLNPKLGLNIAPYMQFTFHYVSIKSDVEGVTSDDVSLFTFHYVSIKSYL